MEAVLSDLKSDTHIDRRRGFSCFLTLWPRQDASPDRFLKGAWFKNVENDDVRDVLIGALLWNCFAKRFPDDFVPMAGRWLSQRGWIGDRPYGCISDITKDLEDALYEPGLDQQAALASFAKEHLRSPFKDLCKAADWRDQDFQVARNSFNAVMARSITANTVIRKIKREVARHQTNRKTLPLLGQLMKRLFASSPEEDDDDNAPVEYRRVVVNED